MAAASPAAGCTEVARKVTTTVPSMKMTSSATPSNANAVVSIERSVTACAHRARTAEPYGGKQAFAHGREQPRPPRRPAGLDRHDEHAQTNSRAHAGDRQHPVLAVPVDEAGQRRARGRAREHRHRRDHTRLGVRPVRALTSRTIARPVIEYGSRATRPAALNAAAPGRPRMRR